MSMRAWEGLKGCAELGKHAMQHQDRSSARNLPIRAREVVKDTRRLIVKMRSMPLRKGKATYLRAVSPARGVGPQTVPSASPRLETNLPLCCVASTNFSYVYSARFVPSQRLLRFARLFANSHLIMRCSLTSKSLSEKRSWVLLASVQQRLPNRLLHHGTAYVPDSTGTHLIQLAS